MNWSTAHRRRTALVLGASDRAAGDISRALLAQGWHVIAVERDSDRLDRLQRQAGSRHLKTLASPLRDVADIGAVVAAVRAAAGGPLDGVVADLAGLCAPTRAHLQADAVLRRALDEVLIPHMVLARRLLALHTPHRHGLEYVLMDAAGIAAADVTGTTCAATSAALRMTARVLGEEAAAHGHRVHLVHAAAAVRPAAAGVFGSGVLRRVLQALNATTPAVLSDRAPSATAAALATQRANTQHVTATHAEVADAPPALDRTCAAAPSQRPRGSRRQPAIAARARTLEPVTSSPLKVCQHV